MNVNSAVFVPASKDLPSGKILWGSYPRPETAPIEICLPELAPVTAVPVTAVPSIPVVSAVPSVPVVSAPSVQPSAPSVQPSSPVVAVPSVQPSSPVTAVPSAQPTRSYSVAKIADNVPYIEQPVEVTQEWSEGRARPALMDRRQPDPYPRLPLCLAQMADITKEILQSISECAEREHWGYYNSILANLLDVQFSILRKQPKGLPKLKNGEILMNTSLITRNRTYPLIPIHLLFTPADVNSKKPFTVSMMLGSDQRIFAEIGYDPPLADWYPKDMTALIWDPRLKVSIACDHIVADNKERLPTVLQNMPVRDIIQFLELATADSVARCIRKPHLPVPMLFMPKKKASDSSIQLLIPVYFEEYSNTTTVLVIERLEFGYRASTILSLDQAYSNARALSSLDGSWIARAYEKSKK